MASMSGTPNLNWRELEIRLKVSGILNKHLQQICANEHINKTGVKAVLQKRIIEKAQQHSLSGDVARFNRLKYMIENPDSTMSMNPAGAAYGGMNHSASPAAVASSPIMNGAASGYNNVGVNGFRGNAKAGIQFKSSPFYVLQQQLGETKECSPMAAHRHTVRIQLKACDYPILSRVTADPSFRVMVFCAAADGGGQQDITFPHQSEIKVNHGEIKANLRGLKNKPGSTRPIDITKELRLNIPTYNNEIEMTYALTNKGSNESQKFFLLLYFVKTVPAIELVARLQAGRRITKDSVLSAMASKARDADIVATASVLSLKCPLSTLRIDLPCRGVSCKHNQCFDGTSYLQLQEQGPTWLCPICNNPATFEFLAVDEYVKDILKNTSKSVDQVTIQPDGRWDFNKKPELPKLSGVASTSDDDDDLIEITKSGDTVRMGMPRTFATPVSGQPFQSREQSTSSVPPRGAATTGGKRPISAVIDLTSSGDDEEPVDRPPKRQFSGTNFNPSAPPYRPPPGANNYRG